MVIQKTMMLTMYMSTYMLYLRFMPTAETLGDVFVGVSFSVVLWSICSLFIQRITRTSRKTSSYMTSIVHAVTSVCLASSALYINHPIDLVNYSSGLLILTMYNSIGYWIYDIFNLIEKTNHSVLLHHVCNATVGIFVVYYKQTLGVFMIGLLTEISSVFVNARQLMKETHMQTSVLYRINSTFMLITFIITRLTIPSVLFLVILQNLEHLNGILPKFGGIALTTLMTILNWYWFIIYTTGYFHKCNID